MLATYIIETQGRHIEFKHTAFNLARCMQIQRLANANKTWKGYYLQQIEFTMNGLVKLHIRHKCGLANAL